MVRGIAAGPGRALAAVLLAGMAAACDAEAPTAENPVAGQAASPLTVDAGAEWILPVEGLTWERARLLALLAFPLDVDPASLQVTVNGRDLTGTFLPVGLISKTWRERSAAAAGEEAGEEMDADLDMSETVHRRLQGILELDDLQEGDNLLAARFTTAAGRPQEALRCFQFQPRGRRVRFQVTRRTAAGEDTAAGARIVLVPLEGAPEVDLSPGSSHPLFPWPRPRRQSFVLARAGEVGFLLPEGRYRAIATGGLRDSIDEWEVPAAGDTEHTFRLRREVDLPGTVTVDFHVHASPSLDSLVPMSEQVHAFLAAGVDILVASDHNTITDYRPLIARLPGAAGRIRSFPGVEASLRRPGGGSWGHWNVWPLEPDPDAPPSRLGQISAHGALALPVVDSGEPAVQGPAVARMFADYVARAAELSARTPSPEGEAAGTLLQLNHPRGIQHNPKRREISRVHDWLNVVGYRPGEPVPAPLLSVRADGITALDFDVLEIWNRSSRRLYEEVRADWFSFLDAGRVYAAAANTDTHTVAPELAGYPLNLVFLPPGEPAGLDVDARTLVEAVREGRMVGTDGPIPLLTVAAGGRKAGPGELLAASHGKVRISLEAQAASWVPVGEARIWVDGRLVRRSRELPLELDLEVSGDAWVVAEVGDLEGVPEEATVPGLYGLLVPRGLALGFTNAVLVDADGDGTWRAGAL